MSLHQRCFQAFKQAATERADRRKESQNHTAKQKRHLASIQAAFHVNEVNAYQVSLSEGWEVPPLATMGPEMLEHKTNKGGKNTECLAAETNACG